MMMTNGGEGDDGPDDVMMIIDDDDEDIDDHQKIEELHKRRNFLSSYCKLSIFNVLPTKTAADVLKHYVTFYNDYGDIIKVGV